MMMHWDGRSELVIAIFEVGGQCLMGDPACRAESISGGGVEPTDHLADRLCFYHNSELGQGTAATHFWAGWHLGCCSKQQARTECWTGFLQDLIWNCSADMSYKVLLPLSGKVLTLFSLHKTYSDFSTSSANIDKHFLQHEHIWAWVLALGGPYVLTPPPSDVTVHYISKIL